MFRKLGDKWQFEVAPLNWKAPDTGQHTERPLRLRLKPRARNVPTASATPTKPASWPITAAAGSHRRRPSSPARRAFQSARSSSTRLRPLILAW